MKSKKVIESKEFYAMMSNQIFCKNTGSSANASIISASYLHDIIGLNATSNADFLKSGGYLFPKDFIVVRNAKNCVNIDAQQPVSHEGFSYSKSINHFLL